MENKLETSQTELKKQRLTTRKKLDQRVCAKKKSKKVTDSNKKHYAPKLNLPCCLGSENPCKRQIMFNTSQGKYLKAGYGVFKYNSEISYAEMALTNFGESHT